MALFWTELSPSATTAMAHLPEDARAQGLSMLRSAEGAFAGLGAPSPLAMVLFSGCAGSIGVAHGDGAWGVAAGASLMGYACRMAGTASEPPHHVLGPLAADLVFTEAGDVDYGALFEDGDRVTRLIEHTSEIAANADAVIAEAGCPSNAWEAFCIGATLRLRNNFVRHGIRAEALPSNESFERLLRTGYALRVVDELVGERPAGRARTTPEARLLWSDHDPRSRQPDDAPVSVPQWIAAALATCGQDFESVAEGLLEAGVPAALGLGSFDDVLGGEMGVALVAHARFGYALRNSECRLLPGSMRAGRDDPLAGELDRRHSLGAVTELLHGIVRYGYCDGAGRVLSRLPGATPRQRAEAFDVWIDETPALDVCGGTHEALALLHYGYLLHRVFELQPHRLRMAELVEPEPAAVQSLRRQDDGHGGD